MNANTHPDSHMSSVLTTDRVRNRRSGNFSPFHPTVLVIHSHSRNTTKYLDSLLFPVVPRLFSKHKQVSWKQVPHLNTNKEQPYQHIKYGTTWPHHSNHSDHGRQNSTTSNVVMPPNPLWLRSDASSQRLLAEKLPYRWSCKVSLRLRAQTTQTTAHTAWLELPFALALHLHLHQKLGKEGEAPQREAQKSSAWQALV